MTPLTQRLVSLLVAYLIGAIPVGYLVARAFGVGDIRRHGSGNIGATNVLRTLGRLPGVLTLVGDIAKGYLAVVAATALAPGATTIEASAGVAAIVGNCWSIFLRFRGGKGGATGLGVSLRLAPLATAPAALVWLVVVMTFRYVSLASITAALCVPLGALVFGRPLPVVLACAAGAAIVVLRHRDNIARLLAGSERRLGQRASAAGRP